MVTDIQREATSEISAADWRDAAVIFIAVLAGYCSTMIAFGHFGGLPVSYFDQLAWSFVHGRTDLVDPKSTLDLARYNGHWYVPFPPLPALLMLPGVSVLGTDRFNVGAFVAVAGSGAAAGIYLVLQQMAALGLTRLTRRENRLLTLAFAFGTISWYMSTTSSVWFVAQVSTYLCEVVALLCVATGRPPEWAGTALGLAAMGRPHATAILPLLIALCLSRDGTCRPAWLARLLAPIGVGGAALGVYNFSRFGAFNEFGYRYALGGGSLGLEFLAYGQFSLHYLPHNLYAMFLEFPSWNARIHFWTPNPDGMSLALVMPFILWITRARSAWPPLAYAAWASLAIGLCPPLLYYNSGAVQFGPRFFLDVMPAAVMLVALAVREGVTRPFRVAVAASVVVNAAGTVWWHWTLHWTR